VPAALGVDRDAGADSASTSRGPVRVDTPRPRAGVAAESREVYERLVAAAPVLTPGRQHPALVSGDLALTASTLTTGGVTVEIARRQPDGSWLWAVDEPALVR